jgi:hypothetical protein
MQGAATALKRRIRAERRRKNQASCRKVNGIHFRRPGRRAPISSDSSPRWPMTKHSSPGRPHPGPPCAAKCWSHPATPGTCAPSSKTCSITACMLCPRTAPVRHLLREQRSGLKDSARVLFKRDSVRPSWRALSSMQRQLEDAADCRRPQMRSKRVLWPPSPLRRACRRAPFFGWAYVRHTRAPPTRAFAPWCSSGTIVPDALPHAGC